MLPGEVLVLDGTLTHPAWLRAPVHERFVETSPGDGTPPAQATRVQVLFDQAALYVGITALDSQPERIRDVVVRNDGVNRTQDFVVVYLDAIGRRSSAQFFRVNAAGSTADGLHTASDDSEDFAPDFDWDAAVARLPNTAEAGGGWTAVLRLPFASLRYAPGAQAWRIMVARRLPREQFHLMVSVPIPRGSPSFISTLQPLQGVQLPQRSQFLTVRPSFTLRSDRARSAGLRSREQELDASLDVKWRPHPSLLVDATLNPDFSQVELDVPQLRGNTRYALALVEKRPFFFESADLLKSPTEALYTRSVTQPKWGLRGTWRGATWAGTAFAIDDRGGGQVLLPGPYGTDVADQPASRVIAGRARSDDGRLALGALAVAREYQGDRGGNSVAGPDVAWQVDDRWRLRGQWLGSRTTAHPNAQGQLRRAMAQDGSRLRLRALRNSSDGETSLGLDDTSSGFRNDSGFVNQAGTRKFELFHSRLWNEVGPLNEFAVNVEAFDIRNRETGELVHQVLRPGLSGTGAHNLEWLLEFYVRSALRAGALQPLLRERYVKAGLVYTPATWFPLLDASLEAGRMADTAAQDVRPGLRASLLAKLRPLRALELEPSLRQAVLRDNGVDNYRESAQQWLAVWHFNARHSLRGIAQRASLRRLAEGPVSAYSESSQTRSLTYAWRRSAGTRLFVGAARPSAQGPVEQRRSELFVKLQFDMADVATGW
ncbi:MAG TPA: DUF5916 domain-containing protein [Rubrivivax sp.]|nr:DUF5916 domain-containing protein [Rubrivivax sp.]